MHICIVQCKKKNLKVVKKNSPVQLQSIKLFLLYVMYNEASSEILLCTFW